MPDLQQFSEWLEQKRLTFIGNNPNATKLEINVFEISSAFDISLHDAANLLKTYVMYLMNKESENA